MACRAWRPSCSTACAIDDIVVRNVPAAVAEKGALDTNLLGMSFLGRLKSFQMQGRELVLVQ